MAFSKTKKATQENGNNTILYIFVAILVATLGLQLSHQFVPEQSHVPLLPQSPDMIELTKYEDVKSHTLTNVPFPEKVFGSELYVAGIYPKPVKLYPAHTVIMVFVKNHARFVQMDVLPNTNIETIKKQFAMYPQESVAITDKQKGEMIHLRSGFDCTLPKSETIPSLCLLTNTLLFPHEGDLIMLSSDGNHISQGELIEMARSIK